jgi:transposase
VGATDADATEQPGTRVSHREGMRCVAVDRLWLPHSAAIVHHMDDKQFYQQVLGLDAPWTVTDVQLSMPQQRVEIFLEVSKGSQLHCPKCGKAAPRYDRRARRWRHLDTCQFETVLVAEVPRVECPEHGAIQVHVPWADEGSKYTALFEQLVIHWLQEAPVSAVAGLMRLSWCAVDGIRSRAVARGRARRQSENRAAPQKIAVDETSFRKRHDYVTVVSDLEEGTVEWVAAERTKESLAGYYRGLSEEEIRLLSIVSMDMAQSYISATEEHVPHAEMKICFDRFHVAQGFSTGRLAGQSRWRIGTLRGEGCHALKGTRYAWLSNDGPAAIRMSEVDFSRSCAVPRRGRLEPGR